MARTAAKTTVYGIPNCDTVKMARVWLEDAADAHASGQVAVAPDLRA